MTGTTSTAGYLYDARGRRVAKVTDSVTVTHYIYDTQYRVLEERDGDGNLLDRSEYQLADITNRRSIVQEQLTQIMNKYRPLGVMKGSEFLMTPDDAIRLIDDLEAEDPIRIMEDVVTPLSIWGLASSWDPGKEPTHEQPYGNQTEYEWWKEWLEKNGR